MSQQQNGWSAHAGNGCTYWVRDRYAIIENLREFPWPCTLVVLPTMDDPTQSTIACKDRSDAMETADRMETTRQMRALAA